MFKVARKIIINIDDKGAVAAEFLVVAPVLLLLLFGILEFYLAMYSGVVLDISLAAVSRIGKARDNTATLVNLTNDLKNRVGVGFDRTKVKTCFVTYGQNWNTFNIGTTGDCSEATTVKKFGGTEVTTVTAKVGAAGDTVVYNATYTWQFVSPLVRVFFPPNGQLVLNSSFSVTNNP